MKPLDRAEVDLPLWEQIQTMVFAFSDAGRKAAVRQLADKVRALEDERDRYRDLRDRLVADWNECKAERDTLMAELEAAKDMITACADTGQRIEEERDSLASQLEALKQVLVLIAPGIALGARDPMHSPQLRADFLRAERMLLDGRMLIGALKEHP